MKIQPKITNTSSDVDSKELSGNAMVVELFSEFLHAELQSLKHQINFSENIIAIIDDEISELDDR